MGKFNMTSLLAFCAPCGKIFVSDPGLEIHKKEEHSDTLTESGAQIEVNEEKYDGQSRDNIIGPFGIDPQCTLNNKPLELSISKDESKYREKIVQPSVIDEKRPYKAEDKAWNSVIAKLSAHFKNKEKVSGTKIVGNQNLKGLTKKKVNLAIKPKKVKRRSIDPISRKKNIKLKSRKINNETKVLEQEKFKQVVKQILSVEERK